MKKRLTVCFIAMAGIYGGVVNAQFAPAPLTITTYDPAELRAVGCDPYIMDKLNAEYIAKRGFDRQREGNVLVKDQVAQAPAANVFSGGSNGATCIENAMNTVKNVAQQVDNIIGFFSGAMDTGAVANNVMNQVTNAACTQINNYTNQIVYGSTQNVRQAIGSVNSGLSGIGVDTPLGNINLGSSIPRENSNAVGGVVNSGIGTVNSSAGGWLNSIADGVFR